MGQTKLLPEEQHSLKAAASEILLLAGRLCECQKHEGMLFATGHTRVSADAIARSRLRNGDLSLPAGVSLPMFSKIMDETCLAAPEECPICAEQMGKD